MPRTLADGKKKFVILPTAPVDKDAVKLAEATAGTDYSKAVLSSDFDLGFVASDRINEKSLDVKGNAEFMGNRNFGGGLTNLRSYLATGLPDATSDEEKLWALLKDGGTHHVLIRHSGKDSTAPFTVDDEYVYVEWTNDLPASAGLDGLLKHRVEGAAQRFSDGYKKIVAGP